jgi:hypothetical protein
VLRNPTNAEFASTTGRGGRGLYGWWSLCISTWPMPVCKRVPPVKAFMRQLQRDLRIFFPNEEDRRFRVEMAPQTVREVFQYGVCHAAVGLDYSQHF